MKGTLLALIGTVIALGSLSPAQAVPPEVPPDPYRHPVVSPDSCVSPHPFTSRVCHNPPGD